MTNKTKDFVQFVRQECKSHGIKFELRKVTYVKLSNKIRCSGWFDSANKKLVVAGLHKDWFETLVHEYAHLTQWSEKCNQWVNASTSLGKVDSWLNGKKIDDIDLHLGLVRDLELDNEKRAVALIKKHELEIDTKQYIKKANSYIFFYNWIRLTKRWSKPGNSPYSNKRILESMPSHFRCDYTKLSKNMLKLFEQEGI